MFQKLLIKTIPYIVIVVMAIVGYFWIGHLNNKIDDLNIEVSTRDNIIEQYKESINHLKEDTQIAQNEKEKDNQEHQEAQQSLIEYNETIEEVVKEPKELLVDKLNKYNECIAKNFNNSVSCSSLLKGGAQ